MTKETVSEKGASDQTMIMAGIALKMTSVVFFVSMAAIVKYAGENIPVGQVVFFRAFFAVMPVFAYLAYRGELKFAFKTKNPVGHFMRSLVGCIGMGLGFYSLMVIPLSDNIALRHAQPLFAVILAAIILREKVRLFRWSAVALGLIGVLIISWPSLTLLNGNTSNAQLIGIIAMMGSVIAAATATILVRTLVQTERSATIVLYFSLLASCLSAMTIFFGWVIPDWPILLLLILSGIAGGTAQILMTEAYRYAPVSTIAPFDYTSIVLGIALGYVVFSEIPTLQMIIGSIIVMASGLFILYREHQLGMSHKKQRQVTGTQN